MGAFIGAAVGWLSGCASPQEGLHANRVAAQIPEIATAADFEAKVLRTSGSVLVEFAKDSCGSCEALAPTIDRLASEYRGRVAFFRVDVEAARGLAAAHSVHYAPTVIVFRDGQRVSPRFAGDYPESAYRKALDKALEK